MENLSFRPKNQVKAIFIALIIGLLMGCSTTADYSSAVTSLDDSMAGYTESIITMDAELTARKNEQILKGLINTDPENDPTPLLLKPKKEECNLNAQSCGLYARETESKEIVSDYPLTTSVPNLIKAMSLLKTYTGHLKEIIEADTAAKITASANSTLGSLESLSSNLSSVTGKDFGSGSISEYKEPVMGLFEWIANAYVENTKVEALAKATKDAQPVINELTAFAAEVSANLLDLKLADAHIAFIEGKQAYRKTKPVSENSIGAFVMVASDYDNALKAVATDPLGAFNKAHETLMNQLNDSGDKELSLKDIAADIARFKQQAQEVKSLIEAFNQ